ncbi:MAG: AAA family ATPase, partial [Clostridiales bacterium]|nr:AAA family ATPase [Clostridiales bacterium]
MSKTKIIYTCSACGYETSRWLGKCPDCNAWNTLEENIVEKTTTSSAKANKRPPGTGSEALLITQIPHDDQQRQPTGLYELDRVLGGGIVEGALMLVGGDPGIGKSTLLLQVCAHLSEQGKKILYMK